MYLPLTLHASASQNSVLNSPLDIHVTFIVVKARVQSTGFSIHCIVDHHSKLIALRLPWGNVYCRRQRTKVPWEHVHPHLKAALQGWRNIGMYVIRYRLCISAMQCIYCRKLHTEMLGRSVTTCSRAGLPPVAAVQLRVSPCLCHQWLAVHLNYMCCSPQLHVPSHVCTVTLAGHEESLVAIIKTTYAMESSVLPSQHIFTNSRVANTLFL